MDRSTTKRQATTSKPDSPLSVSVGISGAGGQRFAVIMTRQRIVPPEFGVRVGRHLDHHLHLSGGQVRHGEAAASVGNVQKIDAGGSTKHFRRQARHEPRRTTASEKHNHSSGDRLIQYRGRYSRHIRGQALTEFVSDRNTGAACLKPSRRTIEALSPLVSLFLS